MNASYSDNLDPVRVTVVSVAGTCPQGFKVGDSWVIEGFAPNDMCASAYHTIFPMLRVLRFGQSFPWADENGAVRFGCPDRINCLVYEMKKIKKE